MRIGREEGLAFRGLAIVLIVLHNVTHLLAPVAENEFSFSSARVADFMERWSEQPFANFFSFYGWIGVSVFVFLSGYGLGAKYGNSEIRIPRWLGRHYLKLLLLMFPAVTFLFFFETGFGDYPLSVVKSYLKELSLVLNILNPEAIWPGIYWYVGMAFQLYVMFVFLRRFTGQELLFVVVIVWVAMAIMPQGVLSYCRHNFFGWLPEFILGMLCSRGLVAKEYILPAHWRVLLPVLFFMLFIAVAFSKFTFFLGGPCFIAFLLTMKPYVAKVPGLKWIGVISAAIYVMHAVVRHYALKYDIPWFSGLGAMAKAWIVLAVSAALSVPYTYYYRFVTHLLLRRK